MLSCYQQSQLFQLRDNMLFNAKLMLVVFILWTGSLTQASHGYHPNIMRNFWGKSVCDVYGLPKDALWIPRTSCEDNRHFSCQKGYKAQLQTTCNKNGKWDLELSCQDCYQYSNNVSVNINYTDLTTGGIAVQTGPAGEAECMQLCANNTKCIDGDVGFDDNCYIFESPAIFASLHIDLDQCIRKCHELSDCLTMSNWFIGGLNGCILFNVTLDEIPKESKGFDERNTVAEKIC